MLQRSVWMRVAAGNPNPDAAGVGLTPPLTVTAADPRYKRLPYSCHWKRWLEIILSIQEEA